MTPRLSVVICTRNPRRDFLERTLAGLREQTLTYNLWELLVVDNGSASRVADWLDIGWHTNGRIVVEQKPGLTVARLRGLNETQSETVVFADDDNVLSPDYLEHVIRLRQEWPKLGCFGAGCLIPEFECEPLPEWKPYIRMLALREIGRDLWSNDPGDTITPWGAGLVVSREVAVAYAESVRNSTLRALLGRRGEELNSGEDDWVSDVACGMGFGKGLFTCLRVLHLIDRKRVLPAYLEGIAEGHAFSRALLAHLRGRKVRSVELRSRPADVFKSIARMSVSDTIRHLDNYWFSRGMNAVERKVEDAERRGVARALQLIGEGKN